LLKFRRVFQVGFLSCFRIREDVTLSSVDAA
jgi:hypothetical protein